jgi:carboxymethylenebutenolidase
MAGKTIKVKVEDGGEYSAYLATPQKGSGPGLIMLAEIFGTNQTMRNTADYFAEEGYVVLVPDLFWRLEPDVQLGYEPSDVEKGRAYLAKLNIDLCVQDIGAGVETLRVLPECDGKVGVIGFCLGGRLAYLAAARLDVDAAVAYYGGRINEHLDEAPKCPIVMHFGAQDQSIPMEAVEAVQKAFADRDDVETYVYPDAGHGFSNKDRSSHHKPSAMVAHSRTIALLHRNLGPHYDLSTLWDKHCEHEFVTRDVDETMATMVARPYVNHIPTMTGGVGDEHLHRFYKHHFIPKTPADTKLIPVSRTIGADRVVDELLFCFTHDMEIDWMLPGVPPTGKYVEIPLVAIVNFRGDKIYHEHIYWDQASVLVQIGLLDPAGLPVAGVETAKKLIDETEPSNTLMSRWAESAPDAAE